MSSRAVTVVVGVLLSLLAAPAVDAAAPPPTEPPAATANEFIPEDRDLSECVSAVPRPDCGSEARGGWRQGLVLGVVVAGLALIGWRIARAVRGRRELLESDRGR